MTMIPGDRDEVVVRVEGASKRCRYRPHAPGTLTLKSALLDALLLRPRPARVQIDALAAAEVLAVGDEGFQAKCRARVAELRARGTAVVLASHDLATVEALCDRAVWLDLGRVRAVGPAPDVVAAYRAAAATPTA